MFFKEISIGKQFSQEFRFNFDNDDKFRGFFGANFFYEDGSQSVPWEYDESLAAPRNDEDRSSIYGGFHTYTLNREKGAKKTKAA